MTAIALEMSTAELGDSRLTRRLCSLVEKVGIAPAKSLPALLTESELEAAYRFFSNSAVTPKAVLEPHIAATVARIGEATTALAIHDTTTMSFGPNGARQGLGRIKTKGQAFFAHFTIAVSADGNRRPLGTLALSSHVRDGKKQPSERDRWLKQMQQVDAQLAKDLGDKAALIHVADREADDYCIFAEMLDVRSRFVIRMKHNRELDRGGEDGEPRWMREALALSATVQTTRQVELSSRPEAGRSPVQKKAHPPRQDRVANLSIGSTCLFIARPKHLEHSLPETLPVNVVRVWEPNPPQGQEPVEWILLTTEPVGTEEQVLKVVDWYRARWMVEEFFKALKTGCAYEQRQIETYRGLLNVLAVFVPVAYHLLLLRSIARNEPDTPASLVLTRLQLQVLTAGARKPLPENPTAKDAMLAIAALGGHLKRNGQPGWIVLSRGYQTLLSYVIGWKLAGSQ